MTSEANSNVLVVGNLDFTDDEKYTIFAENSAGSVESECQVYVEGKHTTHLK